MTISPLKVLISFIACGYADDDSHHTPFYIFVFEILIHHVSRIILARVGPTIKARSPESKLASTLLLHLL